LAPPPLHVVDLGCGSAHLTFSVYYYLNSILGIPTHLTGVDIKDNLLVKHRTIADQLGWKDVNFITSRILDYQPHSSPNIVIALHACDTATDEALAQAVRWNSPLILSAPCCHHHLQTQLAAANTPLEFAPILRHGILFERWGDILTDSFRALILRLMGYRAEVIEFIDRQHTAKNLLLRARQVHLPGLPEYRLEYQALKNQWKVTPYLETLLREQLTAVFT
jgi:SAM-dependent methyltransferase